MSRPAFSRLPFRAPAILARAGVETVWTEKPPEGTEACTFDYSGRSALLHPERDTRSYLVVSIERGRSASAFRETLEFALPNAHQGVHAFIFYDIIEHLIRENLGTVPKCWAMLLLTRSVTCY